MATTPTPPMTPKKSYDGLLRELHPLIPLSTMAEPICATEPRLVLPHPVTLRFHKEGLSNCFGSANGLKITCANTDLDYFYCQPRSSMSHKWVIWDMAGTPVVNFKWIDSFPKSLLPITLFSARSKYVAFPGEKSGSGKELFKLKNKYSLLGRGRISANFRDVCTSSRMRQIVLKWNLFKDFHIIYAGEPEPKEGNGGNDAAVIAKFYSSPFSKHHFVEIAAEVDIALIVTMCLAAMQEM